MQWVPLKDFFGNLLKRICNYLTFQGTVYNDKKENHLLNFQNFISNQQMILNQNVISHRNEISNQNVISNKSSEKNA